METYIVRVYRYSENSAECLGVVEFTDGTPLRRFHSDNELIDIIASAKSKGNIKVHYVSRVRQ